MILTCLYLTGCGREEVPYLDTTQTQEQTVETERTEQKETLKSVSYTHLTLPTILRV